jgi:hypothetical protein
MQINVLISIKHGGKARIHSDISNAYNTLLFSELITKTGYARKGDALLANKLATDAYNAYNSGLRMCPNDSVLTEKSEQAMRAIRNNTPSSSSSSDTSTSRSSGKKTIYTMVKEYAKIGCLIASFCYLIPFSRSFSANSYRYKYLKNGTLSITYIFINFRILKIIY